MRPLIADLISGAYATPIPMINTDTTKPMITPVDGIPIEAIDYFTYGSDFKPFAGFVFKSMNRKAIFA